MIRQLPKLSIPYLNNEAAQGSASDVKVYDVITSTTTNNTEGNTMQLALYHADSETNETDRELHGRLTLNTESLPDMQEVRIGFAFTSEENAGKYDGLEIKTTLDASSADERQKFVHRDISMGEKPDIYNESAISKDKKNDWTLLRDDSWAVCDESGRCEISVAFVRNFDTKD